MLPGANHVALGRQPHPGNTGALVQKGCPGPTLAQAWSHLLAQACTFLSSSLHLFLLKQFLFWECFKIWKKHTG